MPPPKEGEFIVANKKPFTALFITPNHIKDMDWTHPEYLDKLVSGDYCRYDKIEPERFIDTLGDFFDVKNQVNPFVEVHTISEEPEYIMEIMYLDGMNIPEKDRVINDFATLLDINNIKVFGNAILTRTYISNTNNDTYFDDITPVKVRNMLYRRAHTTVVTYDADEDGFKEVEVMGPMEDFANDFFSESKYKIKTHEIGFLKHNLNIWYSEDKYGTLDTFGNILPDTCRVDKMIVFSMWTQEYRDCFTMKEFDMIKLLSKKLDKWELSEDETKEERDEDGRLIVKNKYRILNQYYNRVQK